MQRFNEFFAELPSPVRTFIATFVGVFFVSLGTIIYGNGGVADLDFALALADSFDAGLLASIAAVLGIAALPGGSIGYKKQTPSAPAPTPAPEDVPDPDPKPVPAPEAETVPAPKPAKTAKPKVKVPPAPGPAIKGEVKKAAKKPAKKVAKKPARTKPYDRITWRGVTLDRRTASALTWVEKQSGIKIVPSQGSYNAGGVVASAGTHDGGGAVDLNINGLTTAQRRKLNRYMRKAGFASWYRAPIAGLWGPHIHAILLGHKNASAGAKQQMDAYRAGRNGLANNAADYAWRPRKARRWNHRLRKPVVR